MAERKLIYADDLKTAIDKESESIGYSAVYDVGISDGMYLAKDLIEKMPTIDHEMLPIVQELRARLAKYEQAEAEGRLVVLPCKIGEDIIKPGAKSWIGTVQEIALNSNGVYVFVQSGSYSFYLKDEEVLFIKQEAKAALKERENDGLQGTGAKGESCS